ncbi:alkaline phosphatase family protein [Thalassotalea sp. PS06]|uniref:alkaline phosphatase family protein n=1 Tax=Thalassotalea sp. PS06 TaxID=2594005 RepID=UPI00163D5128|nr:alkaline phosphatase family protein [Thalassotalea sp. PS06]
MVQKNKQLLLIFLDGLKPESLSEMPFLNSFRTKGRIKGEYGYSIACHGSMYSGVHTKDHGLWFVWFKNKFGGPFSIFNSFNNRFFSSFLIYKLLIHKLVSMTVGRFNTSFFGIPRFVHVNNKMISMLDVIEKRNYDEPDYLTLVPSLFDYFRKNTVSYTVVGMDKSFKEESEILNRFSEHRKEDVTYWFLGDVDHFSHKYTQESSEAKRKLRALDALLKNKYEELVSTVGSVDLIVWSDHGHITVKERVDLYSVFKQENLSLTRYDHVIDGTFARFWVKSKEEEQEILSVFNKHLAGLFEVLDEQKLKDHNLYQTDEKYGNLIIALLPGSIFTKTIWGWSKGNNSMHGYNPNYPECDGVIISNLNLDLDNCRLVDITPTVLNYVGIKVPGFMDGKSLLDE